ncbi:transposase [Geotalea uraniireducens]|uniref:Transposase n=1 Tax=Geotalea uraniireducens TaxID=351604 RepID=A0ABM8EJJ8_9BACT|nr:transposase [Geotalea uraniireducens]BDV42406.1 transposase [Geotalea uraniireducens]
MKSHYTAKELAGLPGMPQTERGVQRMADREIWPWRKRSGRGGGKEYALASLPAETRQALATTNTRVGYDSPTVQAADAYATQMQLSAEEKERQRQNARTQSLATFDRLPEWKKQGARAKLAIIQACDHYISRHGLAKFAGQNSFAHEYNLGRIDVAPWVRSEIRQIHPGTMRNWIREEFELGVMGLVDCYGNRKDQSKIETWNRTVLPDGTETAPMADTITALILKHPHITEKKCNEALRGLLPEAPEVHNKTVKRFMDKWKTKNAHQYALAVNPDDFKNRLQPAFGSRSEGVDGPNQRWEIDATPADLLLTDGQRYKIIGVTDVGTARLKYYVTQTEKAGDNAFVVRNCLLDWGVPKHGTIVTDEGSAYVGDHFTRVLSDLEIDHHICNPFSGDEKPHIERSFRTFSHDLIELTPGYCGHNVAERKRIEARKSFAQRLMNRNEVIEVSINSAELQDFVDRWIANYHNQVHSRLGTTPNQAVAAWPHPIHVITDERALDTLLAEAVRRGGRLPIVGKKGIRVNGGRYIHPDLGRHIGERVRAFQDPADLGRIIVHTMNREGVWEFCCIAEDPTRTGISMFEVAAATRHVHNEHKKEIARLTREAKKALKGVDVVDAVMTYREREAAAAQGNVAHFPRPTIEHTTPGLAAAAEARAALDGKAVETPGFDETAIEAARQRWAELNAQETNVIALPTAARPMFGTDLEKYRWLQDNPRLTTEDDATWSAWYQSTTEYRLMFGGDEEEVRK